MKKQKQNKKKQKCNKDTTVKLLTRKPLPVLAPHPHPPLVLHLEHNQPERQVMGTVPV